MDEASTKIIPNKILDEEVREIVKDVYGDEHDGVALNTCEAALWVSFDVLATPPMQGRGDNYRARYIIPYEKHLHHHGGYGRPFPSKYKDIFADRGNTAGELGFYGKRQNNLDTIIVPLMKTDALILATGAARSISNDFLIKEVQCICDLFDLPKIEKKGLMNLKNIEQKVITLIQNDNLKRFLRINSLINLADLLELTSNLDDKTNSIFIPGILTEFALKELIKKNIKLSKSKNIIISNPSHLLVGSNPISLFDILFEMKKLEIKLKVIKTLPILAITINPFYPLYRYGNNKYESAWVDRDKLYNKIKSIVSIPVIDIVREGGNNLFDIIKKEFNLSQK